MTTEAIISLVVLAIATTWTPGPNNIMLASSGANFGYRRTIPHMAGVVIGLPIMVLLIGFVLGQVFESSAVLRDVVRWIGAIVMLWLAWKIGSAGGISSRARSARPMRLYEAAAFQWVNPKAWAMVLAVTSQFVTGDYAKVAIPIIALVYAGAGVTSSSLWTGFGAAFSNWLTTPVRLAVFNWTMALMIAGSVAFLFLE